MNEEKKVNKQELMNEIHKINESLHKISNHVMFKDLEDDIVYFIGGQVNSALAVITYLREHIEGTLDSEV